MKKPLSIEIRERIVLSEHLKKIESFDDAMRIHNTLGINYYDKHINIVIDVHSSASYIQKGLKLTNNPDDYFIMPQTYSVPRWKYLPFITKTVIKHDLMMDYYLL